MHLKNIQEPPAKCRESSAKCELQAQTLRFLIRCTRSTAHSGSQFSPEFHPFSEDSRDLGVLCRTKRKLLAIVCLLLQIFFLSVVMGSENVWAGDMEDTIARQQADAASDQARVDVRTNELLSELSGAPASTTAGATPPTDNSIPGSGNKCDFNSDEPLSVILKNCKPSKGVIETTDDTYKLQGSARERVVQLINNIIKVGSLLAVGAIVYASILYTIAAGDEERVKSAKNALKFGIIGFLLMLISFPLVNMIVNLFYTTSGG